MVITIGMAVATGRASIGISMGDAMTAVRTGTATSAGGIAVNGMKAVVITMPTVGGSTATGRLTMTGVADDSVTMIIFAMDTALDTFGTAVSDCHRPTTHRGTSFVITTPTSCRNLRMAVGGSAWTVTSY